MGNQHQLDRQHGQPIQPAQIQRPLRHRVWRWGRVVVGSALLAVPLGACASARTYVWVDDYVAKGLANAPRLIRAGDRVRVLVRSQDQLGAEVDVRPDGEVVVPVAGSVPAAGKTPVDLANTIAKRLEGIVNSPQVTVVVERRRTAVTMLGELRAPGRYELEPRDSVADALARAGGLTQFADGDMLFVIRREPHLARIRLRYDALTGADPVTLGFELRDGDIIVAE